MLGKLVELIEPISLKHHTIGNTQVSNSIYALHKTINKVTMPMRGVLLRPFRKNAVHGEYTYIVAHSYLLL